MSAATQGTYTPRDRVGKPRSVWKSPLLQSAKSGHFTGLVPPRWAHGPSTSRTLEGPSRGLVVAHARRKWYAVFEPAAARGVYRVWEQVKQLVSGQSHAVHKGFASEVAALEWISHLSVLTKEEDDACEHLRRMILGSDYRVSQLAKLAAPEPLPNRIPPSSTPHSLLGPSSACSASISSATTTALIPSSPRPWETTPIVLPVPTAPSREYYRKWYAVRFVDGGSPGVYNTWQEAEAAICGRYAEHRSFDSQVEALEYAFGRAYVDQLLPSRQQQGQQQEQELQPSSQTQIVAAAPGTELDAPLSCNSEAAAQSIQSYLPNEYDPYGEQSFFRVEHDYQGRSVSARGAGEAAAGGGGQGLCWDFAEMAAELGSRIPAVQASLTSLRAPALAAWDAATARPPPVNPGAGGVGLAAPAHQWPPDGPPASSLGWPLPAPPAMTTPLSCDTPCVLAMVLTTASHRRRRHDAGHLGRLQHQPPLAVPAGIWCESPPCTAPSPPAPYMFPSIMSSAPIPVVLACPAADMPTGPEISGPGFEHSRASFTPQLPQWQPLSDALKVPALAAEPPAASSTAAAQLPTQQQQHGEDSTAVPSRRRPGRPRKSTSCVALTPLGVGGAPAAKTAAGSSSSSSMVDPIADGPPARRRRGRPPKKTAVADASDAGPVLLAEPTPTPKRPRGRPRKTPAASASEERQVAVAAKPKRPRGRPRRAEFVSVVAGSSERKERKAATVEAGQAGQGVTRRRRGRPRGVQQKSGNPLATSIATDAAAAAG